MKNNNPRGAAEGSASLFFLIFIFFQFQLIRLIISYLLFFIIDFLIYTNEANTVPNLEIRSGK